MSLLDPKSDADLRALAQKSRTTALSPNEQAELDRAISQSGSLSSQLRRIRDGKS